MDIIDSASEIEELQRNNALAAMRFNRGESATHCAECGVELPEARRKAVAGCKTCADCQADLELRNKMGRM